MAMPRLEGATSLTTRPPISSWPEEIVSSPEMVRKRVDLPQPEGPTKTMNSPDLMSRFMSLSTSTLP